ncbi:MAG: hypothetical protein ACK5EU_11600 [Pseudanabaena sp.]|jgi:hypothetical protein|nr:hypothetical protein [Pseudanabaena sp. M34BS1SP1A06MG]
MSHPFSKKVLNCVTLNRINYLSPNDDDFSSCGTDDIFGGCTIANDAGGAIESQT